ncbi:MAG: Spy/CpxP family protein refolding chaperone [Deltaproteobacteria bacterium]|nr:Spy/CpxP family protein refolding chaperone [Deltaproteobacteria bacterium]
MKSCLVLLLAALCVVPVAVAQDGFCSAGAGCAITGKMRLGGRSVFGEVKRLNLSPEQLLQVKNIISYSKNEIDVKTDQQKKIRGQIEDMVSRPEFDEQQYRNLIKQSCDLEAEKGLTYSKAREQIKNVLTEEQLQDWNRARGVKAAVKDKKGAESPSSDVNPALEAEAGNQGFREVGSTLPTRAKNKERDNMMDAFEQLDKEMAAEGDNHFRKDRELDQLQMEIENKTENKTR